MAAKNLFEKLEKEHDDLLNKIDELDKKIANALNEWGKAAETPYQEDEETETVLFDAPRCETV